MITAEQIRELMRAKPFKPFRICLSDGSGYMPIQRLDEPILLEGYGFRWLTLRGAYSQSVARPSFREIGYYVTGSAGAGAASGGTRASSVGILLARGFAFRGGRLVGEAIARRVRGFDLGGGRRADAVSVAGSEHLALPRLHPGLRDVGVYLGWAGPLSRAVQAMSAGASLIGRLPGAHAAIGALLKPLAPSGSSGGPDAEARAKVGSLVVAEAFDARDTRLSAVRLTGVNPYDFTAAILAVSAQTAADGGLQGTGALGPVDGFGLEALVRGCAEAGISRA